MYARAIQPVLVGRLTLIPLTCNFGQLRQSVMLDKAFVIGNGIGRQVFYQTWSCRRARKMRVLGSTSGIFPWKRVFYYIFYVNALVLPKN